MKSFILISVIAILFCLQLPAQKQVYEGLMLTGTVKDSATGNPVKKAEITISSSDKKCTTDKNGCFRMIVMSKPDSLFCSHKKYQARRIRFKNLNNDILMVKKK